MLDVSIKKKIDSKHWVVPIDQFYHPTGTFLQDSIDIVYSFDTVNTTKFTPILLKEWFYLVKKNGFLVIDYQPNVGMDARVLERLMWWLWKGKYEIVFHDSIPSKEYKTLSQKKLQMFINKNNHPTQKTPISNGEGRVFRFICKKIKETKLPGDLISKWTFGIITNGKRLDWMEQIIQSIKDLNIPNYEIIVCGTYYNRKDKNFIYVPFNQRDDKGWITKKKNLIVQKANYENICIIHDRLVFDKNWYKGMQKWGNAFEHLSMLQLLSNGARASDWSLLETGFWHKVGLYGSFMDYRDWDLKIYASGQLHVSKKSYLLQSPWNETFYWNDPEDVALTQDLNKNGHLLRFNSGSKLHALAYRFGYAPRVPFNDKKLSAKRKADYFKLITPRLKKFLFK